MSQPTTEHNQRIVEQFTRQAAPFAEMPAHSDARSMRLLLDAAGADADDLVLDVACGPGLVACAMAPLARHVTGIDLTPAMIEQARKLQEQKRLTNLSWEVGDVSALPFADAAFSVVLSRYAFHHLPHPATVLTEMTRVCRPGGRVIVADVFVTSTVQGLAYDRMEKLRDPSHARALPMSELTGLFERAGLQLSPPAFYRLEVNLESLLAATGTAPEAAEQVRQIVAADIGRDEMGIAARRAEDALYFSFPVVVLTGHFNPNLRC